MEVIQMSAKSEYSKEEVVSLLVHFQAAQGCERNGQVIIQVPRDLFVCHFQDYEERPEHWMWVEGHEHNLYRVSV